MVQSCSSCKDFLRNRYSNVEIYFGKQDIPHKLVLFDLVYHQVEEPEHNDELVMYYELVLFLVEIEFELA
jgi:hypothetical protein